MNQIEQQFQWAVQALAQPADVQLTLLPSFVVVADELALDFDHWRRTLETHFGDSWSDEQRQSVQALDCLLGEMSGDKPEIWRGGGCLNHPKWSEVRRLAVGILSAFGWPQDVPPLNRAIYANGTFISKAK